MEPINEATLRDDLNALQVWINTLRSARRLEGVYERAVQAVTLVREAGQQRDTLLEEIAQLSGRAQAAQSATQEAETRAQTVQQAAEDSAREAERDLAQVRTQHTAATATVLQEAQEAQDAARADARQVTGGLSDDLAAARVSHAAELTALADRLAAAKAEYATLMDKLKKVRASLGDLVDEPPAA